MPLRLKGSDYLTQLCLRDRCLLTTMRVAKVNDQSGYIKTAQQRTTIIQLTRYPVNRFNYNDTCYPSDHDMRLQCLTMNMFSQLFGVILFYFPSRRVIKTCLFFRRKLKRKKRKTQIIFNRESWQNEPILFLFVFKHLYNNLRFNFDHI